MKENLESLYEKAVMIAQEAHKGQMDKGGNPYIEHPLHVASQVETLELKMIAVLHDTLEDSSLTAADLMEAAYLDYIRRVAGNKLAARVKKEDLKHNMDMSRIQSPTEKDRKRCAKYEKALRLLEELTAVE